MLGVNAALELEQRVADLAAASNVAEFASIFPEDVIDRSPDERSIRLVAGYDLIFCAGHVKIPRTVDNATDWTRVSRIKIIGLEQTNE